MLVVGHDDLLRVRSSLGRICDELHVILGVIDHSLASYGDAVDTSDSIPPQEPLRPNYGDEDEPPRDPRAEAPVAPGDEGKAVQAKVASPSYLPEWVWSAAYWFVWWAVFILDVIIVIGMQLFLDSIGQKRGSSAIMAKKSLVESVASGEALEEEQLAACLTEHWWKLVIGIALASACRLPQRVLHADSLTCSMLINLSMMLRCMSFVMLLLRDDMRLPKKERERAASPPVGAPRAIAAS